MAEGAAVAVVVAVVELAVIAAAASFEKAADVAVGVEWVGAPVVDVADWIVVVGVVAAAGVVLVQSVLFARNDQEKRVGNLLCRGLKEQTK